MLGPAGNSVKHLKAQACDAQLTVPWVSNTKTIFVGLRPRARSVPLWAPPDGCVTGACAPGPALHLGPPLQGPFNWGPFLSQSSKGLACVWQPSVLCAGSQQPFCGLYCKRFLCPLVPLLFLAVEHPPPPAAVTLATWTSKASGAIPAFCSACGPSCGPAIALPCSKPLGACTTSCSLSSCFWPACKGFCDPCLQVVLGVSHASRD